MNLKELGLDNGGIIAIVLSRAELEHATTAASGHKSATPAFTNELRTTKAIKDLLTSVPDAIGISAGQPKDIAPTDGATINVSAPGWSETIKLIRISQASESGSRLQTRQPEAGFSGVMGSL